MTIIPKDSSLLQCIERFNRKERYIVFQQATADGAVKLTASFRARLAAELGWKVPADGLVLTDFHLTWLYAALELSTGEWASDGTDHKAKNEVPSVAVEEDGQEVIRSAIERNQEDIDLLIAWQSAGVTHLGLIEVKAHSGWSNRQMKSKAARLQAIFGDEGTSYARHKVVPHFALMSFRAPKGVNTEGWPAWMSPGHQVAHLKIDLPDSSSRLSVGQANSSGRPSSTGEYYAIREISQ